MIGAASPGLAARIRHAGVECRGHRGARSRGVHGAKRGARRLRPRQPDRDRRKHGRGVGVVRREQWRSTTRTAVDRDRVSRARRLPDHPGRPSARGSAPRRAQPAWVSPGQRPPHSPCSASPWPSLAPAARSTTRCSCSESRVTVIDGLLATAVLDGTRDEREARLVVGRPARRPSDRRLRRS